MAHAELAGIDTAAAAAAPGVVAVFTAADLHLPAHHGLFTVNPQVPRPPLATDRVRFVGEAVAVVVAESAAAAADAADLVEVDYTPLPAAVDVEEAVAPGAPLQFPDLGSNVAAGLRAPDGPDPLDGADVVVRARLVNQRVAVVPMEGNAIAVAPEPDSHRSGSLTIWVSTQMPHGFRSQAAGLFDLPEEQVRVIAPHVGGAFGGKAGVLAEHTVAIGVARALGRPTRWVDTRSENLVSMPHGRGQVAWYELGLRRDGRITGLRARVLGDAGAYAGFGGALALGPTFMMAQGTYDIPAIAYDAAAVLTNTTPMGAFRGAGRPEAAAHLERMMDLAAAELGLDPVEIRRRNLLAPERFPFRTLSGVTYDVGDYDRPLREALEIAGYDRLRAEQAARRAAGDRVQLGIGVSVYVEITAAAAGSSVRSPCTPTAPPPSPPGRPGTARATRRRSRCSSPTGSGSRSRRSRSSSPTPRSCRAAGAPADRVRCSSAAVPCTRRPGGARAGARAGGGRCWRRPSTTSSSPTPASSGCAGVPAATVTWVAGRAARTTDDRRGARLGRRTAPTFPFGAHVAVVEVDTETGRVTPVRHVAVDDCGRILNPLLVTGQQHGGLAQGIAQALYEEVRFDADGQPLTGTLADYHLPSAADLITFETANTETPTPLNALGAKGIGESATIGSTPAVQNAVVDALAPLGVRHIDLPCTPERVWRAIRDARAGRAADPWREPPAVFAGLPVRGAGAPADEGTI